MWISAIRTARKSLSFVVPSLWKGAFVCLYVSRNTTRGSLTDERGFHVSVIVIAWAFRNIDFFSVTEYLSFGGHRSKRSQMFRYFWPLEYVRYFLNTVKCFNRFLMPPTYRPSPPFTERPLLRSSLIVTICVQFSVTPPPPPISRPLAYFLIRPLQKRLKGSYEQ